MNPPGACLPGLQEGTLVMRRRSPWEAADAGLLLWREHFAWFLPFFALPLWIAAFGLRFLPSFIQPWSYLVLWWMKPLFDRPVLHIIAVRFFEPRASAPRFFRGLGASLLRGLCGDLLWRRFSPRRPGCMPIRILENPKFREMKRRRRTLQGGGLDGAILITILGLALEAALLGGEILFSLTMVELLRPDMLSSLWEDFANVEVFVFAAYCLNYILIESLTVCMGFGIYINSRVEVEGWDIEILLRQFAELHGGGRISGFSKTPDAPGIPAEESRGKTQPVSVKGQGGMFFLCLMLFLLPVSGYAETPGMPAGAFSGSFEEIFGGRGGEAPEEILAEILKSPDFGEDREGWGIRFRHKGKAGKSPAYSLTPRMEAVKKGLAYGLRFCLAGILGGAALFLFLRARKLKLGRPLPKNGNSREFAAPLPEDPEALLDRAEFFHRQGRCREAWAYCFAGAAAAYERCRGIPFPRGATEYECLALVRSAGAGASPAGNSHPGDADGFAVLVLSWVFLAYGGKSPEPGAFERSLAFCRTLLSAGNGKGGAAHG